jgi:hypothetical protein
MKKRVVEHEMDLTNPPPLTTAQRGALEALAAKPESEIDYGEIPPLDDSFWKSAVRNPFLSSD